MCSLRGRRSKGKGKGMRVRAPRAFSLARPILHSPSPFNACCYATQAIRCVAWSTENRGIRQWRSKYLVQLRQKIQVTLLSLCVGMLEKKRTLFALKVEPLWDFFTLSILYNNYKYYLSYRWGKLWRRNIVIFMAVKALGKNRLQGIKLKSFRLAEHASAQGTRTRDNNKPACAWRKRTHYLHTRGCPTSVLFMRVLWWLELFYFVNIYLLRMP